MEREICINSLFAIKGYITATELILLDMQCFTQSQML